MNISVSTTVEQRDLGQQQLPGRYSPTGFLPLPGASSCCGSGCCCSSSCCCSW